MATQSPDQKFFEIIKPGANYEFIGRQKYWIGLSIFLVALTFIMLPLNAFVLKGRGHILNWGVDFRGGSEILLEFSKAVDVGEVRKALLDAGFTDADVVKYEDPTGKKPWNYMVRVGAVSVVSEQQAKQIQTSLAKEGEATLKRLEWAEGGDKIYLRYDRAVETSQLATSLKAIGVSTSQVQTFGRAEDHGYEVTLVGLDTEIRRHLEAKLGAGAVAAIPKVDSVGAKAGNQLKVDGAKSLLQPVSVANVVGPMARTLSMPETQGKIFEVGGPERIAFIDIMYKVARHYGVWPNTVSVSSRFARPMVKFAQRFRSFPLTYDELMMLLEDNVCDASTFTSTFGVTLDPYEAQISSLCPHIYELAA